MKTKVNSQPCQWKNVSEEIREEDFMNLSSDNTEDENDVVMELCEHHSKEFELAGENLLTVSVTQESSVQKLIKMLKNKYVPENIVWSSILSAFESCMDFNQLKSMINELEIHIPPLKNCMTVFYCPETDKIDELAQAEIPLDGPFHKKAIATYSDGNCLPQSASKGYFNNDSHHNEMCISIVMEGVHMEKYLSHACLEHGATYIHRNADLPTVFSTFSEYFTPGQKITPDTIQSIYCMGIYSCSCLGSYMGLWQLDELSSVLGMPLHTIYPIRGDSELWHDFHRMFFPVNYPY